VIKAQMQYDNRSQQLNLYMLRRYKRDMIQYYKSS